MTWSPSFSVPTELCWLWLVGAAAPGGLRAGCFLPKSPRPNKRGFIREPLGAGAGPGAGRCPGCSVCRQTPAEIPAPRERPPGCPARSPPPACPGIAPEQNPTGIWGRWLRARGVPMRGCGSSCCLHPASSTSPKSPSTGPKTALPSLRVAGRHVLAINSSEMMNSSETAPFSPAALVL